MVYNIKNKGYFIPITEEVNTAVSEWASSKKEVLWYDKYDKSIMYLLTHGDWNQFLDYDGKKMSLQEIANEYGEELKAEGIKQFVVICCHGYIEPFVQDGILYCAFLPSMFKIDVHPNSWIQTHIGKERAVAVSMKYSGIFGLVKKAIQKYTEIKFTKKLNAVGFKM
jgi:hypothetical protein